MNEFGDWTPTDLLARLVAAQVEDPEHWAALIHEEAASLSTEARIRLGAALAQACLDGTPPAFILGKLKFLGVSLIVERGVVFPRPVTERVGTAGLAILRELHQQPPGRELRVLDLCCGMGNLACAIGSHDPATRIWACDISPEATALTRRNAARLGLQDRVATGTGDMFGALAGAGLEGTVDLIVCGPPFISTGQLDKDRAKLLQFEPRAAFDGGPYGLSIHQALINGAPAFLRPGGHLVVEAGARQSRYVCQLLERKGGYQAISGRDPVDGTEFLVQARRD